MLGVCLRFRNSDAFWELPDEILNAVLFVLIRLEVIVLSFSVDCFLAGTILTLIVLLARFISAGIPINLMRLRSEFNPHVVKFLTWDGLRGGITVALALSLPAGDERDTIVAISYMIMVLTIVIQGPHD